MAGDFNMNLLDFEQNTNMQNFLNLMFGLSVIPVMNKPARVTKTAATTLDHISINSVTTTKFKTRIIKSDISNHFPILLVADYNIHIKEKKERFIFRHYLSNISVEKLPQTWLPQYKLRTFSWDSITNSSHANKAYDEFINIFSSLCDKCFPKKKIKLKLQKGNNSWITKAWFPPGNKSQFYCQIGDKSKAIATTAIELFWCEC